MAQKIKFNPKQVELLARIHGYKIKVITNLRFANWQLENYFDVHIFDSRKRCLDFESFLRTEFDYDLSDVLFYYRTGWIDRLKAKWGRMN